MFVTVEHLLKKASFYVQYTSREKGLDSQPPRTGVVLGFPGGAVVASIRMKFKA